MEDTFVKAGHFITDYRFEDAKEVLQSVLGDKEDSRREALWIQAELGNRMLQAVSDIDFIDSMVISRSDILQTLPKNSDGGYYVKISELNGLTNVLQGETAYINGLGDAAFVSALDESGTAKISIARRIGKEWQLQPLEGLGEEILEPHNPFVNADGTMLWFVAKGKESLGGYDIFVTRYDAATRRYLKPQNIGMPFNSPFDELLYTIDEERGMGYFLTQRSHCKDSVMLCIFRIDKVACFLNTDSIGAEKTSNFAALKDVTFSSYGNARKIIREWNRLANISNPSASAPVFRLIISDDCVVTDIEQLKSPRARRIAGEWFKERQTLEEQKTELEKLRYIYKKGMAESTQKILYLEQSIEKSARRIREMEQSIRQLNGEMKMEN